jgi:hypothetical protein
LDVARLVGGCGREDKVSQPGLFFLKSGKVSIGIKVRRDSGFY